MTLSYFRDNQIWSLWQESFSNEFPAPGAAPKHKLLTVVVGLWRQLQLVYKTNTSLGFRINKGVEEAGNLISR